MSGLPVEARREARRAAAAADLLADDTTPLIRNAWYAVALTDEVSRSPIARDVMETSLVLFRRLDGTAVALQNRYSHRSFPLAHGTLEGDSIRCGYHGLRYDTRGRCVEVPMQDRVPAALCQRAYPVLERGPFIWIWFGDATAVDESALPCPPWLCGPDWDRYHGYFELAGGYLHLHENLLDLSHLTFLHATTFGTPEYARAPVELAVQGSDIQVWRRVTCELPDLYAVPLNWRGMKVLRSSGSQYVAPGLHVNTGILRNLELTEEQQQPLARVHVAQVITPINREETHYWYVVCRNFARGRPEIDDFMRKAQLAAFAEDKFAIEQIARLRKIDRPGVMGDGHIPTDAAGLAMRRHIKALAVRESAASPGDNA